MRLTTLLSLVLLSTLSQVAMAQARFIPLTASQLSQTLATRFQMSNSNQNFAGVLFNPRTSEVYNHLSCEVDVQIGSKPSIRVKLGTIDATVSAATDAYSVGKTTSTLEALVRVEDEGKIELLSRTELVNEGYVLNDYLVNEQSITLDQASDLSQMKVIASVSKTFTMIYPTRNANSFGCTGLKPIP